MAGTPDNRKTLARFGGYRVVEKIGEGGMCHVFRARHDDADYDCALKLLKENRRDDEQIRDLFITEADLSMLIEHPNVVTTLDAGETDGRYYIAMELIEGATLQQVLVRAKKRKLPIPPDFVMYVVSEILDGLHAIHQTTARTGRPLGLVHRDITPSNIFLSFDGRAILGDLGAMHIQAYGDLNPNVQLGKIGYLAPEMVLGEEIDRRADIFAIGVVLYEALAGLRLFSNASDEELMEQIADVRVERPIRYSVHMHRDLDKLIMRALSRRAADRFETAEEMFYELETFWSKKIANPYAISAWMSALYHDEALRWWMQRNEIPMVTGSKIP